MENISSVKRTKPIPGGSNEAEYRAAMRKIMEGLRKDNLETLLFLCKDDIPPGREINSSLQLIKYLENKDFLSQYSAVYLAEALHIIRRMDLLKVIPCIRNKKHFEDEYLAFTYTSFSSYRVLTVQLQDELSQSDFEIFRHECSQHLNNRRIDQATNVLSLLRSLEEEDIIDGNNYEELLKILENIDNVKPLKMFRRLLNGDESVVMPQQKQMQRQDSDQHMFPDRRSAPNPPIPDPPSYRPTSRVEVMPQVSPRYGYDQGYDRRLYQDMSQDPRDRVYCNEKHQHYLYDFSHNSERLSAFDASREEATPPKMTFASHSSHSYPEFDYPHSVMPPPPPYTSSFSRSTSRYSSMPNPESHFHYDYGRQPFHYNASYPHMYGQYDYNDSNRMDDHNVPGGMNNMNYQRRAYSSPPQSHQEQIVPRQDHPYSVPGPEIRGKQHTPEHHHDLQFSSMSLDDEVDGASVEYIGKDIENEALVATEAKPTEPKPHDAEQEKCLEELKKRNKELEEFVRLQKDVGSYKMDRSPVGLCVLINNVEFEKYRNKQEYQRRKKLTSDSKENEKKYVLPRIDLGNREGSNTDANKLEKLFDCLDFTVERYNDLDARSIIKVMKETGESDHSNYDCFLLIILSHGDKGCIFGVDGFPVSIVEMQTKFCADKCNTLAGKPKIFIIQACQGDKSMPSYSPEADVISHDAIEHDGPTEDAVDNSTPTKSDFLLAYSTVPGYISYRSRFEGSYFVHEIVRTFSKHYKTQDLLSMMIIVNDAVAGYQKKQMPMPIPTLRKKVFFHLKKGCSLDLSDIEDERITEYLSLDESLYVRRGMSTQESGEQE